jgi:hypothetical protein
VTVIVTVHSSLLRTAVPVTDDYTYDVAVASYFTVDRLYQREACLNELQLQVKLRRWDSSVPQDKINTLNSECVLQSSLH